MTKKQLLRRLVTVFVWKNNTASTASRDTDWDDLQDKTRVPNYYAATLVRQARGDIIA